MAGNRILFALWLLLWLAAWALGAGNVSGGVVLGSLLLAVPPTFWVGDAAVISCGNCASSSFNSRVRASYSKSSSSGAS